MGIDISASSHFVAMPSDRDEQPIREFPCFIEAFEALASWLTAYGIDTVAAESTTCYIP
ncbi:MAG: hypothetical protein HOP34_08300 [Methylococcaceae bacterium]|nr:hypothetical protein [Methylococcaceae bacterium]